MITYRLGLFQYEEKRAKEFATAVKRNPGSCDTVWFTTMGYYPPLWKHEQYAKEWAKVLPIYKDAGIKVSIQIANTLGHAEWAQLDPEKKDLFAQGMISDDDDDPYLVGPDGIKNKSCFCPRSKSFRKYINSVVAIYSRLLKPDRLWFDDDLRAHNHKPNKFSCYCDRCISEFNKQHSVSFTRKELVHEINYGDLSFRRKYIDFIRGGIYDFTYGACKAILEVSPDTAFGLEYEHEHNYLGPNDEHILGALYDASGKEIHTRPGGGFYNENPYAAGKPMQRYVFKGLDERSEVLGVMRNGYHLDDGKYIGDCTLITETACEGKWAIFGYSVWHDIVSSAKRNQIVGALDAIAKMPVRLLTEEPCVIVPSVDKENKVSAVTLSAASQSGIEDLLLIVRAPKGKNISIMGTRRNDVEFTADAINDNELTIKIYNLVPYETVTLFFE